MVNPTTNPKVKCFLKWFVFACVVVLFLSSINMKPLIKNATDVDLDGIHGIKITFGVDSVEYGVIAERIKYYLEDHPQCKVEDLRVIKGVDDMIIDQLKERWR